MSYIIFLILIAISVSFLIKAVGDLKSIKTEENAEKRSQDMFSAVGLLIIGGGCLVLFVVILFL
ncbi:MAG: hypothetical protein IKR40_03285 [Treponema sp.]|nr:hypothetical protein [Treponema sp.]